MSQIISFDRPYFLPKTKLSLGAKSKTIVLLQKRLRELYQERQISVSPLGFGKDAKGIYGIHTQKAVEEYISRRLLHRSDFIVDQEVWQSLGLPIGSNLEDFFKLSDRQTGRTIQAKLQMNELTLVYHPRIWIRQGWLFGKHYSVQDHKDLYLDYLKRAFQGFSMWKPRQTIQIQGVPVKIKLQILDQENKPFQPIWKKGTVTKIRPNGQLSSQTFLDPDGIFRYNFFARTRQDANIEIQLNTKGILTSMVFEAWYHWTPNSKLRMIIRNKDFSPHPLEDVTFQHELGHVFGLFDAYSYKNHFPFGGKLFPQATIDGDHVQKNSVMLCDYQMIYQGMPFITTENDWEMILWAFQTGHLQNYSSRPFGKRSQSFYH